MSCNCNIFLKKETEELNKEYENMITNKTSDYFFITCCCGNREENFRKNFIRCINCQQHYYCELCVLRDCYKCDEDNKNNCPICCKRLLWKTKPICETHYEIKQILHE